MAPCACSAFPLLSLLLGFFPHTRSQETRGPEVVVSMLRELEGTPMADDIKACLPDTEIRALISRTQAGIAVMLEKKKRDTMSAGLGRIGRAAALLGKSLAKNCGSLPGVDRLQALGRALETASKSPRGFYHDDCFHFCDGAHNLYDCYRGCDVFETIESLKVDGRPMAEPLLSFLEAWKEWMKGQDEAVDFGRAFAQLLLPFKDKLSVMHKEL